MALQDMGLQALEVSVRELVKMTVEAGLVGRGADGEAESRDAAFQLFWAVNLFGSAQSVAGDEDHEVDEVLRRRG